MDLRIRGKNAIVTGGTRGIGRAIADTFANEGANVAICARNADDVRSTVEAIRSKGVDAYGEAVDIANGEQLKAFVVNSARELGGIDALVSNASAMAIGGDAADFKAMFEIDVLGAVNIFEAAEPFLVDAAKKNADASFTIIGTISSMETMERISAYGAMKSVLPHHAKAIARQYAPKKVRCNIVSPGQIYFEDGVWGRVKMSQPEFFEQMIKLNPTGRMGTPQEIADATVFLSSPLSSFTTGINMIVDGALTHRVHF